MSVELLPACVAAAFFARKIISQATLHRHFQNGRSRLQTLHPQLHCDILSLKLEAVVEYEVAEHMATLLKGKLHPALMARQGSGIIFNGVRKRWVLDGNDYAMYDVCHPPQREKPIASKNSFIWRNLLSCN
jgi:hypothetical protein